MQHRRRDEHACTCDLAAVHIPAAGGVLFGGGATTLPELCSRSKSHPPSRRGSCPERPAPLPTRVTTPRPYPHRSSFRYLLRVRATRTAALAQHLAPSGAYPPPSYPQRCSRQDSCFSRVHSTSELPAPLPLLFQHFTAADSSSALVAVCYSIISFSEVQGSPGYLICSRLGQKIYKVRLGHWPTPKPPWPRQ